jgi:hypothetical protein
MGCPIHIWLPLMGAAAPIARAARDRRPAPSFARRSGLGTARVAGEAEAVADSATRPVETPEVAR